MKVAHERQLPEDFKRFAMELPNDWLIHMRKNVTSGEDVHQYIKMQGLGAYEFAVLRTNKPYQLAGFFRWNQAEQVFRENYNNHSIEQVIQGTLTAIGGGAHLFDLFFDSINETRLAMMMGSPYRETRSMIYDSLYRNLTQE